MPDPLSVTGSAVGVISLGLSVCQGIISYCGSWKDYDHEISSFSNKAGGLEDTLKFLQKLIRRDGPVDAEDNGSVYADVEAKVLACTGEIEKLNEILEQCRGGGQQSSSSLRGKLRAQGKRAVYPFQRVSLLSAKDTLDSLQMNLETALQVAILACQRDQTRVVTSASRSMESAIKETLPEIQKMVASGMEEHTRKIDNMALTITTLRERLIYEPTVLRSLCHEQQEMQSRPQAKTQLVPMTDRTLTGFNMFCTCSQHVHMTQSHYSLRHLSFYQFTKLSHDRLCPLYFSSQKTQTLEARFNFCCRFLGFSLKTAISLTKGAGGFSIAPQLTFRAVVPSDSPAFQLFSRPPNRKDGKLLDPTLQQLCQLFYQRRASPSDVTPDGRTILHYICKWLPFALLMSPEGEESYYQLLKAVARMGALPNQRDDTGMTPLEILLIMTAEVLSMDDVPNTGIIEASLSLIDLGAYVTDTVFSDLQPVESESYIKNCLRSIKERGEEGIFISDLAASITNESEIELKRALSASSVAIHDGLRLSADWPEGIKLLLGVGADVNQEDRLGYLPIDYACAEECLLSVQLLLDAGCALEDSLVKSYLRSVRTESGDVKLALIAGLVKRRQQLRELAEMALPNRVLETFSLRHDSLPDGEAAKIYAALVDNGTPVGPALKVTQRWGSLYHGMILDCATLDNLYHAGFRDVDQEDQFGRTPLMGIFTMGGLKPFVPMLKYASWLISKGADSRRTLPNSTSTALHQFCYSIGYQVVMTLSSRLYSQESIRIDILELRSTLDNQCQDFLLGILTPGENDADECLCSCSIGGCRPLTKMLRSIFDYIPLHWYRRNGSPISGKAWFIQRCFLEFLLPELQESPVAARAIIRFLTFTEMGLPHTCCYSGRHDLLTALDKDEVEEIRDENRITLDELEDLTTEFEAKYDELSLPLTAFLGGYWTTRMQEVWQEEPANEDYIKEVQKLGVVLDK